MNLIKWVWRSYVMFTSVAFGADSQDFPWIEESFNRKENELISFDHPCDDVFLNRLWDHPDLTRISFYTKFKIARHLNSFSALTACQHLQELSIPGIHIEISEAQILTQLPNLKSLTLTESYIWPKSWPILSQLSRLQKLDISGSHLYEASLPYLGQLTGLETLTISHCGLSANHIQKLQDLLPHTKIIGTSELADSSQNLFDS